MQTEIAIVPAERVIRLPGIGEQFAELEVYVEANDASRILTAPFEPADGDDPVGRAMRREVADPHRWPTDEACPEDGHGGPRPRLAPQTMVTSRPAAVTSPGEDHDFASVDGCSVPRPQLSGPYEPDEAVGWPTGVHTPRDAPPRDRRGTKATVHRVAETSRLAGNRAWRVLIVIRRPSRGASPDRPTKTWKLLLVGIAGGVVLAVWVVLSADPAHPEAVGRREMLIFGIFAIGLRLLTWIGRWHRWVAKAGNECSIGNEAKEAKSDYSSVQEQTAGGDSQCLHLGKRASRHWIAQLAHDWLGGKLAYSDFSHAARTIPNLHDDEDLSELMYLIDHASAGVQLHSGG